MKRSIAYLALLFAILYSTTALECWECDNAENDEDCKNKGHLRECPSKEDSCFSETRLYEDGRRSITRRCKQDLACFNNEVQNPRPAWDPTQCSKRAGSVCRCCCGFNGCNGNEQTACKQSYDPIQPKICGLPEKIANGYVFCKTSEVEVQCHFYCKSGYERIGDEVSVCNADNVGTDIPYPHCERKAPSIKCPLQTGLKRVVMRCSNGNAQNSECSFQCSRDAHHPKPGSLMHNYCTAEGKWSSPAPCCQVACPPKSSIDLFVVMDSSSSIGQHYWNRMVIFVSGVISQFNLGPEDTQVFVIRYNNFVDEENQLLFNNRESRFEVLKKLTSIPYNGRGTKTGKALNYVHDNLMKRSENREDVTDVVLLITDGTSYDDVTIPSEQLRSQNAEVFAMGLGNKIKKEELIQITGNSKNVWSSLRNFSRLTKDVANTMGKRVCENSC